MNCVHLTIFFLLILIYLGNLEGSISQQQASQSNGEKLLASQEHFGRKLQIITPETPASCNLTLYQQWANERYVGVLSADVDFWIYQTQPQVVLTNGLALQLVVIYCKRQFTHLFYYKAGKSGPVTIQNAYKPMCSSYCLQSDLLHQRAMEVSGCDCLELSTQPSADSFTSSGDWCSHNSGKLLCDMLGYCGVWDCDISDFMCPRYEWNKKQIAYIGLGTCTSGAVSTNSFHQWKVFGLVLIVVVSTLLIW